jgi:flagellar M-ring protein FliF
MQTLIQFFKDTSPIRLIAAAATFAFMILFFILITKLGNNEMSILYTDLDIQDSAKIAEELDKKKINYTVIGDGSIIKVKRSEVVKIRLSLAKSGLPSSGSMVGYEIFDKEDSIGATNFSQNVKLIRALEGELGRTISAFDQVDKGRVHLVMPQREIFSKEKLEPRASVVLKFRGNKSLGKAEIDAISHLVVTSVPGLEMHNVTIVDTKGRALKIGSAEELNSFGSGKNEEMKVAAENRLRSVIEELLTSSLGLGRVKAQVALEMNFDRIVTNSETYDPDSAVVRSVQTSDENEQTPVGSGSNQDASVANNIPGGGGGGAASGSNFATSTKSDQTTNYEISKIIRNQISESGLVKKMSIGILVDGVYSTDPETGEAKYSPRSQQDLDKIINLVKVAVGFDEDRNDKIEVVNMQFAADFEQAEDSSDWIKGELPNIFQTLVFAIVVLLVLITVIRPIALKAFEIRKTNITDSGENQDDVDLNADLGKVGAPDAENKVSDAASMEDGKEAPPEKPNPTVRVNEIAGANPQELVNILRKWLHERN